MTNNEIILTKLQNKLSSLIEPSFVEDYFDEYMANSRGSSYEEREVIYNKHYAKYTIDYQLYVKQRNALEVAIKHYEQLVAIDYALTLIN